MEKGLYQILTRRELLGKATTGGLGLVAAAVFGSCREDQSLSNLAINYEIIDEKNKEQIDLVLKTIKASSSNFPTYALNKLPPVSPNVPFKIPSLLREDQRKSLANFGIKDFAFVQETQNNHLAIITIFHDGVKLGKAFKPDPIPYSPSFIFFIDENLQGHSTISKYELQAPREHPEYVRQLWLDFPLYPKSLAGITFIVHFNAQLLTYRNRDLPSFSLPYRFIIRAD